MSTRNYKKAKNTSVIKIKEVNRGKAPAVVWRKKGNIMVAYEVNDEYTKNE